MNNAFEQLSLPDELLRGIGKSGFDEPTPIQSAVIPVALTGVDLMAAAATGSGKTAAFLLPMLARFVDEPSPRTATRGLVLVPTRELARQVLEHFLALACYTRLSAALIMGGEDPARQIKALRRNPELVIGTPGRLLEHLNRGVLDLGDLEVLVLDEADRMLDLGFAADVTHIISTSRPERQSMLFSATLERQGIAEMSKILLRDPELIRTDPARKAHADIRHQIVLADDTEHKHALLRALLETEPADKALVFTNTRAGADALGPVLIAAGQRAAVLHGELTQEERKRTLALLKNGQIRVLVATDVAARGLDLPGLDLVINFEAPHSGTDYLHRSGRTGRAGSTGIAITLVGPMDWKPMDSVMRFLDLEAERRIVDGLQGSFSGPSRGRRSKNPKKKTAARKGALAKTDKPKVKERLRDRKNKGKRRKPSSKTDGGKDAGGSPLRKKKPRED